MRVGKMYEAVADEHEVGGWERIVEEVEYLKLYVIAGVLRVVAGDEFLHDVAAEVLNTGQVYVLHPVKITAGEVEQGRDGVRSDDLIQPADGTLAQLEVRALPGN